MPIQIRLMSWNIQKKTSNAPYIAALMRTHQIDICALLEVPNSLSFTIPHGITTALNNLNPGYFQNQWKFKSVDVGNEAVTYIWHENNNVGPNAFKAATYANGLEVAGKVLKNGAGATIYFPTTKFKWASLPGRPAGRRPAFMLFVTNDGVAARGFTFLDLHTPFNTATSIQSYTTHLYASAREILSVETVDAYSAASAAQAATTGLLAGSVDPLLTGIANYANFIVPQTVRTASVTAALAAIQDAVDAQGADPATLFSDAVNEGINAALKAVGTVPGGANAISRQDAERLARACAMAGAVGAASLVASIQLPTAPPAATASVNAAGLAAQNAVTNVAGQYNHPAVKNSARIKDAVRNESKRMARAALAPFTFAALPQTVVQGSIVAGDFNVHYPDATVYTVSQQGILGGTNAYAALIAATNGGARNQATTTRIGPTAFEGQRIYTLRIPCPVQHTTPGRADYVPLDLTSLVNNPTDFVGHDAWVAGLQNLPRTQNASWAQLTQAPYADRLNNAFDKKVIDDTSFYRANCYDNIFVRGAAVVNSAMLDVMSELGSWLAYTVPHAQPPNRPNPNPWPAAAGTLNPIAQAQLGQPNTNLQFTYNTPKYTVTYTITPALADAEEAAVFFDRFISDHLPVAVEIQI